MQPQSTTACDPTLARFVETRPLAGRPKRRPLVQGAFIIVRLSKRKEKMSSLTMQERHARTYIAERLHVPVLGVFQDIKSGLLQREGYQEAMKRARMSLCSHIVVYDYDRFSRERVSSLKDYQDLEHLGIEIHDTLNGYIDHETAGQKACAAELEARKTSRRILDNMVERAMNPEEYNSPRRYPFGYKRSLEPGNPDIDEDAADVVRQMFRRYDEGASEAELWRYYQEKTGRRCRIDRVRKILRNEYYAGIDIFNKTACGKITGHHAKDRSEWVTRRHDKPLVDIPRFERVQARLDAKAGKGQERRAPAVHALRGLVWCARCERRCKGRHVHARGITILGCPYCQQVIMYKKVEPRVQEKLAAVPLATKDIRPPSRAGNVVGRVQVLTHKIEALHARRGALLNRKMDAEIARDSTFSEADYLHAMAQTQAELRRLEAEREELIRGEQQQAREGDVLRWLSTLSKWTDVLDLAPERAAQRNEIYKLCIERITLDFALGRMTIRWAPAIARLLGSEEAQVEGLRD